MARPVPERTPPAAWRRLESVIDAALDAEPADRERVLAERCANDAALHRSALAWLRACDGDAGPLDAPAPLGDLLDALGEIAPRLAPEPPPADADAGGHDESPGAHGSGVAGAIGRWRLVRQIGRGGMGTVHLAQREDAELPMRAAVKLMNGSAALDPASVRRFRDERRILAALEHPAIARLLDGGVTASGLPWFAMEYVSGAPVDAWCDGRRLGVEGRLRLFARVCDAVQHAHAHLVVHRDLKPANVLVSDTGEPKLLDFGIAKLLASDAATSQPALTQPGLQPMTRAFAAPEQLRGEAPSTATDIHALGVLLHVLLSGHHPFGEGDGAPLEHRILAGQATRPSAAVRLTRPEGASRPPDPALPGRIAAARGTTPARLQRRLRGDLDTIVARALHPEPSLRYATADALAADVRRHLDGLPVLARPTSAAYRLRKLVRRNPLGATATAAATVLVVAFAVVTAVQDARLRTQAERLTAERDKAAEVTAFLTGLLSSADPYESPGRVPTLRDVLDRGAARIAMDLQNRPEVRAHLLSAMAPAYFGIGDWTRAGELAEQAVALRRPLLAPDDPELAAALVYLANVRLNQRRAADAEGHAREALTILGRHLARGGGVPPGLDSARILGTLGAALQGQGRLAEAETVLRRLLAVERGRAPEDARRVAQVARNLAHALRDARRHAEAVPLYAEAYALHRATFGDEHPETANSAVNLGIARVRVADTLGGERLLRLGVETKRRLLGIAHPDVAGDQLTLAAVLQARGAAAEAARLRDEANAALGRLDGQ